MNFLRSGFIHFLTDNLFQLTNNPITQRQVRIYAAGQFSDHPGSNHQLVAYHLGIGRNFPACGQKHF
jgi:hypothetical protein